MVEFNGEIQRIEIPEVPVKALREAIINSFAHARYDINIKHEIDIFLNRISITNPGCFANDNTPLDYFNKDLKSFLHNEKIAKILFLCNDVETFGKENENIKFRTLPASKVLSIYHNGTYETIGESYAFILDYAKKNSYEIVGLARECYIDGI